MILLVREREKTTNLQGNVQNVPKKINKEVQGTKKILWVSYLARAK